MIPFTLCAFILVMSALYANSGVGYQIDKSLWRAFLATAGIFGVSAIFGLVVGGIQHLWEINFDKNDARRKHD